MTAEIGKILSHLRLHLGPVKRVLNLRLYIGQRRKTRLGLIVNTENVVAGRHLDGLRDVAFRLAPNSGFYIGAQLAFLVAAENAAIFGCCGIGVITR